MHLLRIIRKKTTKNKKKQDAIDKKIGISLALKIIGKEGLA